MSIDLSKIKKILVIQLRHHGDVLLTTPLLYTLKKQIPNALIDVYIYKEAAPILEGLPFINKMHLYDRSVKKKGVLPRMQSEMSLMYQLRRDNYDLVINMTEGDRGALVCLLTGAKISIGPDPKKTGMWMKEKCYTHVVKEKHEMRHKVEMNLDLISDLGIVSPSEDLFLHFSVPIEEEKSIDEILKRHHIQTYYLIHPVSRWMFKSWPVDKVASFMNQIYDETRIPFVITGSNAKEEMAFVGTLVQRLHHGSFLDLSGKINLKQLGALIKRAKMMVSVDSVPMHMAAAFKTPLIAIFGPTSDKRWAPWQHPRAVIVTKEMSCRPCYKAGCNDTHVSECLETLSVDEVKKAFYKLKL